MANDTYALLTEPQRGIAAWRAAFAAGDGPALRPLLADNIIYHSPGVASPVAGRDAAVTVLAAVRGVLEDFREGRTFVGGPCEACLEFSATFRKAPLKGVSLLRFTEQGLVAEVEVLLRPMPTTIRLADAIGDQIGPALLDIKLGS